MADTTAGGPGPSSSGPSAASRTTTPKLFVRQSSGLVRNVSVTNALFFNVAAFVGVGLTLYPIFYSLADVNVWRAGPFSAYGWAAIIAGLFCILLAMIFASLTSVMPRSGGDYVFTSRILHPFLGWMESWSRATAGCISTPRTARITWTSSSTGLSCPTSSSWDAASRPNRWCCRRPSCC